jgi:hypothetical protein
MGEWRLLRAVVLYPKPKHFPASLFDGDGANRLGPLSWIRDEFKIEKDNFLEVR